MVSLVLEPMIPNLDLISDPMAPLTIARKIILINQSGTFWSPAMSQSVT